MACSPESVCPGLTSAPLVSAFGFAAIAPVCPPLTGPGRLEVIQQKAALTPGFAILTGILSVDGALITGLSLSAFILIALGAAGRMKSIRGFLERCDVFTMVPLHLGEPLKRKPRPIGGACTLLGGIVFLTVSLILVLQRESNNVQSTESVLSLMDERKVDALKLPVFSSPKWGSGIQIRITVSGDADPEDANAGVACARDASFEPSHEGWLIKRIPVCGSNRASQLIISCHDCRSLSASSLIKVKMNYSCQSLQIEAAALDGSGIVSAFRIPTDDTVSTEGQLLSSISWTIPTLLSVLNSSVSPSSRGFLLINGAHKVTRKALLPLSDGLGIQPATATLEILLSLPLNNFYAVKVLSEKQSLVALLSSIVGLAGIFGFFGILLSVTDSLRAMSAKSPPPPPPGPPVTPPKKEVDEKEVRAFINPVHAGAGTKEATATETVWRRVIDGKSTWFESVIPGESVWTLPAGARIEGNVVRRLPVSSQRDALAVASPKKSSPSSPSTSPDANVPETLWRRVVEGNATWFESVVPGESVWELPPGGRVEGNEVRMFCNEE